MAIVRLVLVRPENSANVGAIARVVANTGLEGIDLVEPCDWRTVEAWRMAWRSENILEQTREYETLDEAVGKAHYVAGLVGRTGMRVEPISPRQMAHEIADLEESARAAVVLGCESKGLSEEELCQCQRRVTIPTHPRQPSLNLAQAAMVASYEIFLASGVAPEQPLERAPAEEVERAYASFKQALLEMGFLTPENPEARFVEWRELFGRAGLTSREVRILLALSRKIRNTTRIAKRAKRS
jgi:tRNA/rRNA methyltransferase